jgi:hypothetical protein
VLTIKVMDRHFKIIGEWFTCDLCLMSSHVNDLCGCVCVINCNSWPWWIKEGKKGHRQLNKEGRRKSDII